MQIRENVALADYSTMKIGGPAKFFTNVKNKDDLIEAVEFAQAQNLPILVIGEGSNTIFTDHGYAGLVIKNEISGFNLQSMTLKVGAGEKWDDVVAKSVESGLTGLESLSAIPGTAGAAPVQNIGAYGQELADTFSELEAYDTKSEQFVTLKKADCGFGYRTSIFKTGAPGRYIITQITLELASGQIKTPLYSTLQKYLDKQNLSDRSPTTIRQAVKNWRVIYLPDPSIVPNCGSFFSNPIITKKQLSDIKKRNPQVTNWPTQWYWELPDGQIKVAAGRLAELAGLKDWHDAETGMATWKNQALVLVNEHAKSYHDLQTFKQKYLDRIESNFGITLEQEPATI